MRPIQMGGHKGRPGKAAPAMTAGAQHESLLTLRSPRLHWPRRNYRVHPRLGDRMDIQTFNLELTLQDNYQFNVRFDQPDETDLVVDEAPPLGDGLGPNPARLLGAAVGSCLSASLLFCLRKAHINVEQLKTTVHGTIVRNEQGRYRIGGLSVRLEPGLATEDWDRSRRCREIFEDFCTVTESVRHGIEVDVSLDVPEPVPALLS